jgi:hypothetical protein
MVGSRTRRPFPRFLISGATCLALAGCQRAPDTGVAAQAGTASSTPASAGASLGIRPDGDTEKAVAAFLYNDAGRNSPARPVSTN